MDTSLSYLDNTEIANETQLTFQEHKVEELITKQISLEYNLNDVFLILALLISLGSMILAMIQNHISISSSNGNETIPKEKLSMMEKSSFRTTVVVLIASIGFGGYAHYQESQDKALIQNQINKTISSINTYKTCKAQQEELQKLKQLPPRCICQTPKIKKPCKN